MNTMHVRMRVLLRIIPLIIILRNKKKKKLGLNIIAWSSIEGKYILSTIFINNGEAIAAFAGHENIDFPT